MNGKKLISPQFRLTVGNYIITNGMYVECMSSRKSGIDWGRVSLESSLEGVMELEDGEEAVLELGYDGDYDEIIRGCLSRTSADSWKELLITDDLKRIRDITVRGTFIDCTPQDIITYVLMSAGIERYELEQTAYPKKDLVIKEMSGLKAIAETGAAWDISKPYYFKNGIFRWGTSPDQTELYVLEEDGTLMTLEKVGTMWRAETIAIPWIHHSQEVIVRHTEFSGTVQVEDVKIESNRKGTRMILWFRG